MAEQNNDRTLDRRQFVGGCTATVVAAGVGFAACRESGGSGRAAATDRPPAPSDWWEEGRYVDHRAVNSSRHTEGIVRAFVDGRWADFSVVSLPQRFMAWNLSKRLEGLDKLARVGFDPEDLDGPHNGCVATFGGWKRGSITSLNTAYMGLGFVPKPERLEETLAELDAASKRLDASAFAGSMDGMVQRTEYLRVLYSNAERFDRTKQVSLELFASPIFATHTFLNMMANPIASISFLAFPTFEIRAVPELLHPDNPKLDAYRKNVVAYVNGVHNFAHGGKDRKMTCVYHVLEVYDDSPGGPEGAGTRIA